MFKNFIENLKAKITKERQYEAQRKWDVVKEALTRKFTADDMRSDTVNLPVWCRVNGEMKKIKTRKMLDHYYDRYVKKVLLNVAEHAYSINKDYDIWEIPYHKFYDDKKFTDLQALQFVSETLTNNQENVSETLTNDVSETLTGGEVKNLQNLEDCKQNTYNGVSETLTENENLSVKHLQEQGVNSDKEGNTDPSKDIIKDNIKTYIKDIHIGEDKKNTPKIDPYFNNPVADKFKAEYKKIFNKSDCYLDNFKLNKLIEINSDNPDFINLIPAILEKFSKITFTKANKKPTLKWLIFSRYSYENAGDITPLANWLVSFDFVVLDDLGRETYTDKRKETAFRIIDALLNYKVVTAFTANPEMLTKLKAIPEWNATLDRLKEVCKYHFEFKGDSLRGVEILKEAITQANLIG